MVGTKWHELERLLTERLSEAGDAFNGDRRGWVERSRSAIALVYGEGAPALHRFDVLSMDFVTASVGGPLYSHVVQSFDSVRGMLKSALDYVKVQSAADSEVQIGAGSFHPWLQSAVQIFPTNPRSAVQEAARSVEISIRAKTLQQSGTAVGLVSEAFSTSDPTEAKPRLRFTEFSVGTESWRNAHEGAGNFGRGCFQRIRNLYSHGHEPSPQEAYEALAALSLLARWVDNAILDVGTATESPRP